MGVKIDQSGRKAKPHQEEHLITIETNITLRRI